MNDDKDVNPAATSSPAEDVNSSSASSAEQTPQPEVPASKEVKPSNREALIAKLTAKNEQAPEQDELEETPVAETETTPSEQPAATKDETPAPAATETADEPDPSDAEIQHYSENAQKRIRQAIKARKDTEAKLKDAEPLAGFGADILNRAQSANVPPQVFADWVDVGVEVYSNPQTGAQRLVKMAESLGYKTQGSAIPEGFDGFLKKLEEELEISPDAAKAIRSRLKPAETPAPTPPAEASQPQRQTVDNNKLVMDKAVRDMNQLSADMAKAHGASWNEIEAAAAKRLEEFKGSPPSLWPNLFKNAVNLVVAERKAAAPPVKLQTKTLRPTTAPPGKEAPKSNRARVLQKYT